MDGPLRGTVESLVSHPKSLADPNKTLQLVLRETAFAHEEYENYVQLIHGLIQAESNHLGARSTYDSHQSKSHPPHVATLK